ncbi:hypothetical protein [Amnibacterium kyonggiense]
MLRAEDAVGGAQRERLALEHDPDRALVRLAHRLRAEVVLPIHDEASNHTAAVRPSAQEAP